MGRTTAAIIVSLISAVVVAVILVVTVVSVVTQLPAILDSASAAVERLGLGAYLDDFVKTIGDNLKSWRRGAGEQCRDRLRRVGDGRAPDLLLPARWTRLVGAAPRSPRTRPAHRSALQAQSRQDLNGSTLGTGIVSALRGRPVLIMTILGLPLAFPIGVLTFFGGFIPYIGSAISTGLPFSSPLLSATPSTSWRWRSSRS